MYNNARYDKAKGMWAVIQYRKLPIISGALTFEISSPMGRLFSGGAYFRGGRLLSSSKKMLVEMREVEVEQ